MTLIVNSNCSFFQTSATKILKYEQLKFSINVNNKKWLFHHQKFIFVVIFTKIQFSVIFGNFFSVFAYFFALKSVGRQRLSVSPTHTYTTFFPSRFFYLNNSRNITFPRPWYSSFERKVHSNLTTKSPPHARQFGII